MVFNQILTEYFDRCMQYFRMLCAIDNLRPVLDKMNEAHFIVAVYNL